MPAVMTRGRAAFLPFAYSAAGRTAMNAEMPLFQAFLHRSHPESTSGLCIKDGQMIDLTCGSGN